MRVLVLDGSRVLPSLVGRLAPEIQVETAGSFAEVGSAISADPPHGLIVNLTPAQLPWSELFRYCCEHEPPIPVLFESCIYRSAQDAGVEDLCDLGAFLAKPYSLEELRSKIDWLVRTAYSTLEPDLV